MNPQLLHDKATLVFERLKNLHRPANENEIAQGLPDGGKSIGLHPRDFGMDPWDWPQGVGLYGLYNFYQITKNADVMEYLKQWFRRHLGEGLPLRNINTSAPMFALTHLLGELGAEAEAAVADWASWLMTSQPRTREGGLQHTTTKDAAKGILNMNDSEVWIDTLFMAVLFLAKYGVLTENKSYVGEAIHQFLLMIKYLYDKATGLFYHGFTFQGMHNFGGIFWCRGNCWFTMAVVELLEMLGDNVDSGVKTFLLDTYRAQVETLVKLQAKSGLWHTVLNDPTSYKEVSGSAGFAYGIQKGIRLGYLDDYYKPAAEKAVAAILCNISEDGTVLNVSAGTSIGRNAEHYRNILIAPMAYGQSLTLLAFVEAMRG